MPVYKDEKKGTWFVSIRYVNWKGERDRKLKRGFKTKREAQKFERTFLLKESKNVDMLFKDFVDLYLNDCSHRLKENTIQTKEYIIKTKILPYLGEKKINEIKANDIIEWQNIMLAYRDDKGKPFSPCYLKTLHNQLSSIFNYAVRFYDLPSNPARTVGNMGKEKGKEIEFWTREEYLRFSEAMMDKDVSFHAFEMLYWCGLRVGELLALTPSDFDFEKETVKISKSYQRIKGRDVITSPKTEKSNRTIIMPHFLVEEMKDYISRLYGWKDDARIFVISKSYLHHEMERGCKETKLKKIRIHGLRHSHVSLLIEMGFDAVAIADRVGHESIDITYRYAHLFPSKGKKIAQKLNMQREEELKYVTEE